MAPTVKAPAIEAAMTAIVGINRIEAAERGICTVCKQPLTAFRDFESEKEYMISGLCQACQDKVFT